MDPRTDTQTFWIGQRVEISGRELTGTVAFIGTTSFATGKWIGLILDEPKGKNNGSFQGTFYFDAPENHGLFVRQAQLIPIEDEPGSLGASGKKAAIPGPGSSSKTTPSKLPPEEAKVTKQSRSRIPGFGFLNTVAPTNIFSSLPSRTSTSVCISSSSVRDLEPATSLSRSPFKLPESPSRSTVVAKLKGKMSLFSKSPTVKPSCFPETSPRSSKSFFRSNDKQSPKMIVAHAPRSVTFSGFGSTQTMTGVVARSATQDCMGLQSLGTPNIATTRVTCSRSVPHLSSSHSPSTSIPFPSFKGLSALNYNSPILSSASSLKSESESGVMLPVNFTTAMTTPPKKPPRLSLAKTPQSFTTVHMAPEITVNVTPTLPSSSSFPVLNIRKGHASVKETLEDHKTVFLNSEVSGLYCKRRRDSGLRLPIAGTIVKDSAKGLQVSPSTSKNDLTTPTSTITRADSSTTKRQSFVETIAEPIVPQYTQGPLFTPTMTPGSGGSQGEDRFGTMQLVESLRHEVKDLHEKLDILKAKRAADQDKLREVDRLRLQVETLAEFKTKVLENQASLQKDLKKARQDARDAIDAKEKHAEEMSDLSEAVEMATLDKEMAEEKAETLQMELEQSNEKIAQLTTELTAIQDELGGKVDPGLQVANSVQMKQLVGENTRMREALLKFRDSAANDKHQLQKLLKEAEVHKTEAIELAKIKERLENRCEEMELQISDLQDMNDAALGAEEMVVNLTEKNLNLEEKVSQLAEAVADLEALQDVNEQLHETAKEAEMEVRDELYRALAANSNIVREKEALIETLGDREMTIVRFRELVQKLRDENEILRKNLEDESSRSIPGLPEALDFKKIFAETKAQTTAIDLEIRRIEAKEAALHVTYLSNFMPDGFMKRGGDNDALLVLLLIPRMICKVELLLSQVRDKLVPTSFADGIQYNGELGSSPDVERYAFSCQFSYLLYALLSELHRWSTTLDTCSTDDFLKVGVLFPDLSVREKSVDFYLELLRKSQLDENIPLDGLEKCISSFQSFHSVHLSEEQLEHNVLVSDLCLASAAACDCLIVDVARLVQVLKKSERDSHVGTFLQEVKTIGESLRQLAKRTRRYLPDPPKQPPVSNKLQSQLLNDAIALTKVVKVFQGASKLSAMSSENDGGSIPNSKVEEYFQSALESCETRVEGGVGYKEAVKEWLTTALMTMSDLAQVVNEAPVLPKSKPPSPLTLRSEAVKAELDQSRNLRIELESKEATITELRKILRSKQEEFSEATIRKELAEKKLSNATKDNEMTVEKLNRKLEDTILNHQRKEREFQATMEHFQAEMESIENEKGELKEKLMSATKRRLLEGIAQSAANSSSSSPPHTVLQASVLHSSLSQAGSEIVPTPALMEYTRFLQRENWKLKSQKVLDVVKRLKPIEIPNREGVEAVRQLEKEYWKLKHESNTVLCESLKVALNKELGFRRKQFLLDSIMAKKSELSSKMVDLKGRIDSLMATRKEVGVIKADFTSFSPKLRQQEADIEAVKVGMIRFPGWEKRSGRPIRIVLSREQLKHIHSLLLPI